ncbi:MAG: carbohydrate kinase [Anaerolineaceae bacterium]|nr:carbohydrate kinase [Anaerolineaceae bacterium]
MTFLAIDIGSSSTRAVLFDQDANLIEGSAVSRKYHFDLTSDGGSSIDADYLKMLVEQCIDEALTHPSAKRIRAVGMATFVSNMMGVDRASKALTPVYTYGDTRNSEDVEILSKTVDMEDVHQRTGCRLHTAYHPARLHWLRRTQAHVFSMVDRWVDFGSYLYADWFGEAACSFSVASWSGLLNRQALDWDREWLAVLGLTQNYFPPLEDFTNAQSGLVPAYASRWPALREVPFYLAVGDGAVANVGMGASTPDALAVTIGTTAALRILYPASEQVLVVPKGLWAYRLDKDHHLMGGATSEGGNVFQWIKTTFPSLDFERAQEEIMGRGADSHGLTCLPLFNGERSPGWNSGASGTLHGLRLSTTPTDILQSALEGVALRLALIARQLPSIPDTIYVGGGGAVSSPVWTQMICNAINRHVKLVKESEPTAHGVALLLAQVVYQMPLGEYVPVSARTFTPEPENVLRMSAAGERQANLYRRLYDVDLD